MCSPVWIFKMCLSNLPLVQAESLSVEQFSVRTPWCWWEENSLLLFVSGRLWMRFTVWETLPCCSALSEPSWPKTPPTSWKFLRLISLPACKPFSYLYKNSFCTVLLKERGFDIWLFCRATWLLLSSCARVAKLSVTSVCFLLIEIRVSFFLDFLFEFEYVNFFFLIKVLFQMIGYVV